MVSTARAWLPAEHLWPQPVHAPAAASGPGEASGTQGSLAAWLRQLGDGASRDGGAVDLAGDADGPRIRRRVADALGALAALVEPALTEAVRRARQAWDQADALVVFDRQSLSQVAVLRRWLASCAAAGQGEAAGAALEGLLALDAAVALIRLFERRLAALLRLQLRSDEPELLPRGRPFLDLAAALREAEQAWR